jgi:hypothetical protein
MKYTWAKVWEGSLTVFKFIIAIFMMVAGVMTCFGPLTPMDGALGWVYQSRIALVSFGVVFFLSGLTLFYGKARRSRRWTGHGLMAVFCCFWFAAILETIADNSVSYGNFIAALILAALYLRWKFKMTYINPRHFLDNPDQYVLK